MPIDKGLKDEDLVREAQKIDRKDLDASYIMDELFYRYKRVISGKANLYFMVGADMDDVKQEGMIGFFKAIMSFDPDKNTSFYTYANHCINNQILTAVRKASASKHEPLNQSVELPVEDLFLDRSQITPETSIIINEGINWILANENQIFSMLEKKVWHLFMAGMDYKAIAKSLGKTPKAIDNAIQRMKKKIQDKFN